MTSLDDLVRDTLAARAHDVDGLTLTAPTTPPRRTGRWTAVAMAVAVAAAIVVAVVLLVPGRGTPQRAATPAATPATPPAGRQWVSFHGITLTVPADWPVQPPGGCGPPSTDAVSVAGPLVTPAACPAPVGPFPQSTTQVLLTDLDTATGTGDPVTVAGRPASRTVATPGSDVPWSMWGTWPVQVRIDLPAVRVTIVVVTPAETAVQEVLDGVEYLPVDHLGCSAEPTPDPDPGRTAGEIEFPDTTAVAVCEYSSGEQRLLGSRTLTDGEVATLRALAGAAEPGFSTFQSALGGNPDTFVYRLLGTDGAITTLTAAEGNGHVAFSDSRHAAEVPAPSQDLPVAYPTR